jgi:hypothetical protein
LEGLGIEKVGIFCGNLDNITAIWYILWPFGNLVANWYIFARFGILCKEKSGNPGFKSLLEQKTTQAIHLQKKVFKAKVVRSKVVPIKAVLAEMVRYFS